MRRHVNFIHLALLVIGMGLISAGAWFGIERQALQTVAFPLMLIVFYRLPLQDTYRLPVPLVAVALLLWGGSALNIRGFLGLAARDGKIFLGNLAGDPAGARTREMANRYRQIAAANGLPPLDLLQREFSDGAASAEWLSHTDALGIIAGSSEWLRVQMSLGTRDAQPSALFAKAGVSGEGLELRHWGGALPLAVAVAPERITVPAEPYDLSLHLIGWTGAAFRALEDLSPPLLAWAVARDALSQATGITGHWRSAAPQGAAHCMVGTLELLEATAEAATDYESLRTARAAFARSLRRISKKNDPEAYAAALNNAAITALYHSEYHRNLSKIRKGLWTAAQLTSREGRPVRGARAALFNLVSLESSGFL